MTDLFKTSITSPHEIKEILDTELHSKIHFGQTGKEREFILPPPPLLSLNH